MSSLNDNAGDSRKVSGLNGDLGLYQYLYFMYAISTQLSCAGSILLISRFDEYFVKQLKNARFRVFEILRTNNVLHIPDALSDAVSNG